MDFDPQWLRAQVREFARQRPAYELYAHILRNLLESACRRLGIESTVGTRAKGVGSFTEKAVRKLFKYKEPVHQITDLCGARVVTYTQADAEQVYGYIRRNFVVDEANTVDAGKRLRTDQFGYKAMHFVVQMPWVSVLGMRAFAPLVRRVKLPPSVRLPEALARPGDPDADRICRRVFTQACRSGRLDLYQELLRLSNRGRPGRTAQEVAAEEIRLLKETLESGSAAGARSGCLRAAETIGTIGNRKAEIQVCTALQHVWSLIGHDRLYKAEFRPPRQIERQLHRVSALLEQSDEEFGRGVGELDEYRLDYGAYMTAEQRREELAKWEEARRESGEVGVALRIAGLAASLDEWETVIRVLLPHDGRANQQVLTLLGRALSRQHRRGRAELKRATELQPENPTAWCYLGDTYCNDSGYYAARDKRPRREQCRDALGCYKNAYSAEPENPTALSRYLECRLCAGESPMALILLKPGLEAAHRQARRWAGVGVHMPSALYEMAIFDLLLGRPYDSLGAYAKAVFLSDSTSPVEKALRSIERLNNSRLRREAPELAKHVGWAQQFLRMAVVAKHYQLERLAAKELAGLDQRVTEATYNLAAADRRTTEKELSQLKSQRNAAKKALQLRQKAVGRALARFRRYGYQTGTRSARWRVRKPVTVLVGGCDAGTEQLMRSYRRRLLSAFKDCSGAVFSAGTTAGIGGLVGEIQQHHPQIRSVGYLPRRMPGWAVRDARYREIRLTSDGDDFSALEPLQNWADIIASGIRPEEVRLLGINGGRIAAFEYRMALAFDAWVAVLEESGREAAKLLPDEAWSKAEHLMVLPPEPDIIREYLRRTDGGLPVPVAAHREALAVDIHNDVLEEKRSAKPEDPSMFEWPLLSEMFKESSRQQVDHMFLKLRRAGCGWRVVPKGKPVDVHRFDEETVEKLAEIEHARFVIERFRAGWRYGAKKDVDQRMNPTLVGWHKLPDDIKEYDRKTVRKIPQYLAKFGIEIECPAVSPMAARPKSRKRKRSK